MPPKDYNSHVQQALAIGKNKNYWHSMKQRTPFKYNYIYELGSGNLIEGHKRYLLELEVALDRFSFLYSEIEYDRMVSEFSRVYEYNKSTVTHTARRTMRGIKTFRTLLVMRVMIPQMEVFIEERMNIEREEK